MRVIFSIIEWILTVIMSLILIFAAIFLFETNMMIKMLPASVDELSLLPITIKTSVIGGNVQILTPQEYPTQFEMMGIVPNPDQANSRVKPGDKVSVYLKKSETPSLESNTSRALPVMIAYGFTLQDGEKLVDPAEVLSGKLEKQQQRTTYKVMSVPVLYFLLLVVWKISRRKKAVSK